MNEMNDLNNLHLYDLYKKSPLESHKWESYFYIYEEIFNEHKGKDITFVEVGVHNGGSLFMWKEYFGKNSRIVGVDLNPNAKLLEEYGFEIYIGSQNDSDFWDNFHKEVNGIDILLDDGSHDYYDQILTLNKAVPNIRDNGIVIIEDTHTSYIKRFGYKTTKTFTDFIGRIISNMHKKHPQAEVSKEKNIYDSIYKITSYESITAFYIDSNLNKINKPTMNHDKNIGSTDFRYSETVFGRLLSMADKNQDYLIAKKRNLFIKILLRLSSYYIKSIHQVRNLVNRNKINKMFFS